VTVNANSLSGRGLLTQARRQSRPLYWVVGIFSFFVNLLMLTGPLYVMNIYDRVLSSRSVETLVALSLLVVFLYSIMGILDQVRGRIMGRVAARFQARLDRRVFEAVVTAGTIPNAHRTAAGGLQDLEALQKLITSPALLALFDMPWVPLFFLAIFAFHPMLGILAIVGAGVLLAVALLNQVVLRKPLMVANAARFDADGKAAEIRQESEMVLAMGLRDAAFDRWQIARAKSLAGATSANDTAGTFTTFTKTFRLFLQSAMLGLGAFLVLQNQLSAGAMLAASILLGRGLAPIETVVSQWGMFHRAHEGWQNLSTLLDQIPVDPPHTQLPKPRSHISVEQISVVPPGSKKPTLRLVSFEAYAGQAIGVIGASGAGKSTLAYAMTGLWHPAAGAIRLDQAPLDQYGRDDLGRHIGYLPQRVPLFEGTIKENIARLAMAPDDLMVVAAAKSAGAHTMILDLPQGYDTPASAQGGQLSGGQIQRIGLARALYGDPFVVILDEPNAHLDHEGCTALNTAVEALKAAGKIVFIIAHRPSAIQACDMLLVLEDGARRAFGPKEVVLAESVANHADVAQPVGKMGGAA